MAQVTDFYIQPQERNSQFHMQEPDSLLLSLYQRQVNLRKKKLYYEQKFWQDKDDTSCGI